jgi:hypothetical protein
VIEKQIEKKVNLLHTDNGMEFYSNKFSNYYSYEGIV